LDWSLCWKRWIFVSTLGSNCWTFCTESSNKMSVHWTYALCSIYHQLEAHSKTFLSKNCNKGSKFPTVSLIGSYPNLQMSEHKKSIQVHAPRYNQCQISTLFLKIHTLKTEAQICWAIIFWQWFPTFFESKKKETCGQACLWNFDMLESPFDVLSTWFGRQTDISRTLSILERISGRLIFSVLKEWSLAALLLVFRSCGKS